MKAINTSGHRAPNILWICTDQQRWDTLGCYGNEFVRSKNLDRLASEGALFRDAFSQSPVCTPSRGSFLTGRYPRTCRARQNGADIPADEIPVTKLLADAGYICGLAGKLHLSACHPSVCPGTERRIDDGYSQFFWSHDSSDQWPTNEYRQWYRDRRGASPRPASALSPYLNAGVPAEFSQSAWCAEKAVSFIRSAAAFDHPWLFSINFYHPHHPFDPPEDYMDRYLRRLDEIPLPNYRDGELAGKPEWQAEDHRSAYGGHAGYPFDRMTDRDHRLIRAAYWAMCDLIDDEVGRVLTELESTGQRDNTLVIFMSDHGELLGDHGIYLKGPHFYDPAVRVPLILRLPGTIPAGSAFDELVELVDLAPTILDAVGLPQHEGMQGMSLWNTLTGSGGKRRDSAYCEYYNAMPWHQDPKAYATMVRTEGMKLALDHCRNRGELYDLASDPMETRNLWKDDDYSDVKEEMLLLLARRLAFTADPLPARISAW